MPQVAQAAASLHKGEASGLLRPGSSKKIDDFHKPFFQAEPPSLHQPSDDLIRVLRRHAEERPDQSAFVYLLDGCADEVILTYADLDRRARAIAVQLREMGLAGHRVLLAYPHGIDFIAGFFGCLYAGCVAVPTCLPHRRTLDRFHAIAADAGASLVLSTTLSADQHQTLSVPENSGANARPIPWLATDKIPDTLADQWRMEAIAPDALAMLQYTSGSTSQPKGVMITHANLIHNTRAICQAFGLGHDLSVFWLPAYHDMGLVGGVLEPMLAGVCSVLMSPATFLQRPIAWLAAISKHRATISGAPNFAYDLCVRKITDEDRATLDLSCWSLAFVGAEPIQPETLDRFTAAFAPCGFKASAFYPCYGLAESTLMVSGATRDGGATVRAFDEAALAQARVECVRDDAPKARRLVSCGKPIGDTRVAIVDATTCREVSPGRVGEVWIAGASVANGYWQNAEQSRRAFGAKFSDTSEGPFLRTKDTGFVFEGQLYVTGREDDMLIVRGLNHHPHDLEATARASHPRLESGLGAAFAVDEGGHRMLVLVHEVTRNGETDHGLIADAARAAVLEEHGLMLQVIVLVRSGTISRTSSGKVQRSACRAAFSAGELKALAVDRGVSGRSVPNLAAPVASPWSKSDVLARVCQHALTLSGEALSKATPDTSLSSLGLDSLQRAELAAAMEKVFSCRLPDAEFNPSQTLGELANAVEQHLQNQSRLDTPSGETLSACCDFAQFPEYGELVRYKRMLKAIAGDNPYFKADQGGASSASMTRIEGRNLVNFCAYDYISMAHDPAVAIAAKAAIDHYGTSAGASRLVSGEKQVHRDLENELAAFLGTAAALVFVSGHATNVTTIGHLFGPEDLIVHDVLAHNSIIQGAQLSGATRRVFAHNNATELESLLSDGRHRYRRVLIAIEGVYSMDGDYPDLRRFVALKKMHKAMLLVDEAHSLGTMGATGRGIGEHFGVARTDVDMWMGTLSKSLASCGGYIAGSSELIEYLGYTAPGFVYSVGVPPSGAAAALAALKVLRAQPQRVSRLRELSTLFLSLAQNRGLNTGLAAGTPVIPVITGNSVTSLRLARALFNRGINVQPILHPAVPEHSARLRFFITTNHTEAQIRDTVSAVADELARL